MEVNFGIKGDTKKEISHRLHLLLADHFHLYLNTLSAHWNLVDKHFGMLHELFEKQYENVAGQIDLIAERIRKLGFECPNSLDELLPKRRLKEMCTARDGKSRIERLAADYETLLPIMREDIDHAAENQDHGTADMLTGMLRDYEKAAWFLRSHIE